MLRAGNELRLKDSTKARYSFQSFVAFVRFVTSANKGGAAALLKDEALGACAAFEEALTSTMHQGAPKAATYGHGNSSPQLAVKRGEVSCMRDLLSTKIKPRTHPSTGTTPTPRRSTDMVTKRWHWTFDTSSAPLLEEAAELVSPLSEVRKIALQIMCISFTSVPFLFFLLLPVCE